MSHPHLNLDALKRADFKEFIATQQFGHWRFRATRLGDGDAAGATDDGASASEVAASV